jgi:hypothetical protein
MTCGSLDYGEGSTHRGAGFRAEYTIAPNPTSVTGAMNPPKTPPIAYNSNDSIPRDRLVYTHVHPPIPNIEFPTFDGSNPRLWIKHTVKPSSIDMLLIVGFGFAVRARS